MPPLVTGALGGPGSQLGLFQCGAPPAPLTFPQLGRAAEAVPLVAHVYQVDGVTFIDSFVPLERPLLHQTTANGSFDQIKIAVASFPSFVAQGNVIKLTEQDGDGSVLWSGNVEDLLDEGGDTPKHEILASPWAFELDDSYVSLNYPTATDVAQMVRDAVSTTLHCSCDQLSVPAATGLTGVSNFTNQAASDVLNTARSIAGPTWFWYVDPDGRVWFQPQGSGSAPYTIRRGQDYTQWQTSRGSLADLRNDVPVTGAVVGTGVLQARYQGSSIGPPLSYGRRTLSPPLSYPSIADLPTLQAIASNLGVLLDRLVRSGTFHLLPAFGQPAGQPNARGTRINPAQPGGAMLRYIEPASNPMQESSTGSGRYVGPFLVRSIEDDGLIQKIDAADIPPPDQTDEDNLAAQLVSLLASGQLTNPSVPLTTPGTLSPGASLSSSGGSTLLDATGLNSAAIMSQIAQVQGVPSGVQAISSISDVLLDDGDGDQATATFTLTRPARVKVEASVSAYISMANSSASGNGSVTVQVDGVDQETVGLMNTAAFGGPLPGPGQGVPTTAPLFWSEPLTGGPHTIKLVGFTQDTNTTLNILGFSFWIFLLGS